MTTRNKVIKILAEYSGKDIEGINENSSLVNDLELDSLDILELTMIFGEEFNLTIVREDTLSNDDAFDLEGTVGDIISYLERKR